MLSLGLAAGAMSVASASSVAKSTSHASADANTTVAFQGVITGLPTGSITVLSAKGTSKTYAIATTTTILRATNVKNTATLAVGDRVLVRALASAPTIATSINILAAKANASVAFQGVVTALPTGSITVLSAKGTSKTYAITASTTILRATNVKHSATLAVGDRVVVRAMSSALTTATTINIIGAKK
ncbi:MAG: hypothetical protein KGJ39_00610 [Acidobacteriota bacterium]|nr:hypothetical protein [Acidobacteriota bacterium]